MSLRELEEWLDEQSRPGVLWFVKRLSGNDTRRAQSNQSGPYIPKSVVFEVAPSVNRTDILNPRVSIDVRVDSHDESLSVNAIWYNNRSRGEGTRNEIRMTGWGGASSALQRDENTGSLTLFAFQINGDDPRCRVWVCRNVEEENAVEGFIGPVDPGKWRVWRP